MAFNIKKSVDDVFIRSALIAMIHDLNNKVFIEYVKPNQEIIQVPVPFFIDLGIGSNDRFYRDFYYPGEKEDSCTIIHNYDKIPRIHVTPGGISINIDQLTSPFGQGEYTETIDGKETWVSSHIHMIPISIDLDFIAKASTFTEILKIWQALMDYTVYSVIPSNFVFRNINCESSIITEIPSIEKTFNFISTDVVDDLMGLTFSGRIETFYPSIRDMHITNIIEEIQKNYK